MTAEELRKSILQMAIQGKLVKQDPNDEPASVLLERIREEKTRLIKEGKIKGKMTDSVIYKGSDNSYYEKVGKTEVCIDDEIPFELPDSWAVCRCNQILSICTGKKDANYGTPTGTFPFFTCSATPIKSDTYSFDGKSLILPGNGANVGMCLYYEGKFEAYQRTYVLQPFNDNSLNIAYVKLIFDAFWREYNKEKMFGSAIPYIKLGYIERFILPIPPLHEQERIVAKIHVIDKLVEDYAKYKNAANTLNEQLPILLRKSILQYAIQGKLVPQAPSDEPASVLLERIRSEREKANGGKKSKAKTESYIFKNSDDNSYYEKIGEKVVCIDEEIPFDIPDSWCWTRIGCVSNSYIGLTYKPTDVVESGGTIVLRSSNIQNGEIDLTDLVRVSTSIPQKLVVEKNDILICARNGSKKLVGKSAIIRETLEDMSFGAFMAICKSPLYEYLYLFLQSNAFYNQLNAVSGTTTINQLTQDRLNHFLIPIPPLGEQRRICEKYGQIKEIASQ